jgi:hypothetical protein
MVRIARVVDVIGNAGNGVNDAKIVKLSFHDKTHEVTAYAKELNDTMILVELLAALVGRELGLPIPEPIIAISSDDKAMFASLDVKTPDFTTHLTLKGGSYPFDENKEILEKLAHWILANKVIGFDEWIANCDRNTGNILYDGNDIFYLIDHNLAMNANSSIGPIPNLLLDLKLKIDTDDISRQKIKNEISLMQNEISKTLAQEAADKLISEHPNIQATAIQSMVDFLGLRLSCLANNANLKIKTKQVSL